MKILLLVAGLCSAIMGFSQTENNSSLGGSYIFYKAPPGKVTTQERGDGKKNISVPLNAKIVYLYHDTTRVYYSYWEENDIILNTIYHNYEALKGNPSSPDPGNIPVGKYFSMDIAEFTDITKPLYRRFKGFTAGAYTIPFRLRSSGDNFDFESALSLQANFIGGFGPQTLPYSVVDFSFGVGLTGVKLNSSNSIVAEERTASAFTFSFGTVYKPTRFINAGIFYGWDFLGKTDRDVEWTYNRKPWLGVGINLSFNELTTDAPPDKAPETPQTGD